MGTSGLLVWAMVCMALVISLTMACNGGAAPLDAIKAELESENIDPSHYVVDVAMKTRCEAHVETGFMENFKDEKDFINASNAKTEFLYLQYDDEDEEVLVATILAMDATIEGGTDTRVFCESLGIG